MIVRFTVPGQPVAKGRPRMTVRGGHARAYTPAKTVAYEGLIALAAQDAMAGRDLIEGPVHLVITASFLIPPSWSAKKRAAANSGMLWHTSKPDGDNIAKAVGDGLNGVVFADDSQVAICKISKQYGATPGLDVLVEGLTI
jgi:Holliday junction resolvase RusA-like endonuclease